MTKDPNYPDPPPLPPQPDGYAEHGEPDDAPEEIEDVADAAPIDEPDAAPVDDAVEEPEDQFDPEEEKPEPPEVAEPVNAVEVSQDEQGDEDATPEDIFDDPPQALNQSYDEPRQRAGKPEEVADRFGGEAPPPVSELVGDAGDNAAESGGKDLAAVLAMLTQIDQRLATMADRLEVVEALIQTLLEKPKESEPQSIVE